MKLKFLLVVVSLVPATWGRSWSSRKDGVAKLGGDENTPPKGKEAAVFYDGGYTISAAPKIQLVKKSTVSITDWVTVTRDPDNSEGPSESPSSSSTSTSPAIGSLEGSSSSATAAESTASLSSSEGPRPDNSTTSASLSASSTSAVSGAPPITSSPSSSSEASTSTAIPSAETSVESSAESSHSSTLIAPPAPVTSTAPAPSESLTEPASESSSSSSSSSSSPSSSTHWTPTTAPDRPPVTLTSLTSGFSAPISSTITFILPSHHGTHVVSEALGPSPEEPPPAPPVLTGFIPPGDGSLASATAPSTSTLTAPPVSSTSLVCDATWCSEDGISYCMHWEGVSGVNSNGIVTPGEVFTTFGTCSYTKRTDRQVSTFPEGPFVPALSRHGPGSAQTRVA